MSPEYNIIHSYTITGIKYGQSFNEYIMKTLAYLFI